MLEHRQHIMQRRDLHQLGDEPFYCEAHHDDVLVSGSDDDYYEAPQHRRIRIEAKALQFLNGHNPVLLTSRLQGPFDAVSWNNPWKSRRAQRQNDGAGPDKRRTHLYPLPSPEITDPPSAAKNSFLDDDEYSRISKWRQAVKSVPLTTDPFWASDQGPDGTSRAKKRAADEQWIPKHNPKRPRTTDQSPSQVAASVRKRRAARSSGLEAQPPSSTPLYEDELAAPWADASSAVAIIKPERHSKSPDLVQAKRSQPSTRRRLRYHNPDVSEDELSVFSKTPSRKPSRLSLEPALTPVQQHASRSQKSGPETTSDPSRESSAIDTTHPHIAQHIQHLLPRQNGLQQAHMSGDDVARRNLRSSHHDDSLHFRQAKPLCTLRQADDQHGQGNAEDMLISRHSSSSSTTSFDDVPVIEELPQQAAMQKTTIQIETDLQPCSAQETLSVENQPREQPDAVQESLVQVEEDFAVTAIEEPVHNPSYSTSDSSHASVGHITMSGGAASQPNFESNMLKPEAAWSTYINTQDLSSVAPILPIDPVDAEKPEMPIGGSKLHKDLELVDETMPVSAPDVALTPTDDQEMPKRVNDGPELSPANPTYPDTCPPADAGQLANEAITDSSQTATAVPIIEPIQHGIDVVASTGADTHGNDPTGDVGGLDKAQNSVSQEHTHRVAAVSVGDGILKVNSQSSMDTTATQDPSEHPSKPAESTREAEMINQAQQQSQSQPPKENTPLPDSCAAIVNQQPMTDQSARVEIPIEISLDTDANKACGPEIMEATPDESVPHHPQSPWQKENSYAPSATTSLPKSSDTLIEAAPAQDSEEILSKQKAKMRLSAILNDVMNSPVQTPVPRKTTSEQQSPRTDKKPSGPNSPVSLKKFSDFMDISPCKSRRTISGSILRESDHPRLLFGPSSTQKATRRVSFALLPGEEAEPTTRAASPPPFSLSTTEAGLLPDQDNKFAKHFEVMAKRKKEPQWKTPRLIPPDSPEHDNSQGVTAMVDAFIQVSDLEKGAMEVSNTSSNRGNAQQITGSPVDKNSTISQISRFENRENIEPVDEVSAVLDNIDDFLDNTWGIDMGMDIDDDDDDDGAVGQKFPVRKKPKTGSKRLDGNDDDVGGPMLTLDVNVWAD